MKHILPLCLICAATPIAAEETRQLDAHEHGVGALNIAFDGNTVAMEFHAPGADIVGFEYAPETEDDRNAIDAAVALLAKPLDLFSVPTEAACNVTSAHAELEGEDAHDAHDHDEEHAEHDDEDAHNEHDHDEEHAEHGDEDGHTEFHAGYTLTCANPEALTEMTFNYFETFENARELEIQVLTAQSAQAFEVERDQPVLDLSKLF